MERPFSVKKGRGGVARPKRRKRSMKRPSRNPLSFVWGEGQALFLSGEGKRRKKVIRVRKWKRKDLFERKNQQLILKRDMLATPRNERGRRALSTISSLLLLTGKRRKSSAPKKGRGVELFLSDAERKFHLPLPRKGGESAHYSGREGGFTYKKIT